MSVATCLGLDHPNGPHMLAAAAAWQRWCHQDPALAVVDDLVDLPAWTCRAKIAEKDSLLSRLHLMAQLDAEAAVVVSWLLLPGARRLASRLADLSCEVDALVAGALWIRVRTRPASRCVASTILREVRQSVLSELGIGEYGRRADPVWTQTKTYDDPGDLRQRRDLEPIVSAESESGFLVQAAVLDGAQIARDVSELVLLKNNMSALPRAFTEGQDITQKILASAKLYLAKNVLTIVAILFAGFVSLPFPADPRQISWITSETVGFPCLALAFGWIRPNYTRGF